MRIKRIPRGDINITVSEEGKLFNVELGGSHTIYTSGKGYERFWTRVGKKHKSFSLHRMVAELFVAKPERHQDVPFEELQVNHIDGVKKNNSAENLEWVTGKENMEHARKLGLFSNEKIVLARNVKDGEIKEFQSISELSREIFVRTSELSVHLNSICAGAVVKDGWVYKFDNGVEWPTVVAFDYLEVKLGKVCDFVAENVVSGKRILFASLPEACALLGLNFNIVKNTRTRKGVKIPCFDWIFYPFQDCPLDD